MASDNSNIGFTFRWKVGWSQYDKIKSASGSCSNKLFITAHNNVVYKWTAGLVKISGDESGMISFDIRYTDGPLETINDLAIKIGVAVRDGSIRMIHEIRYRETNRDAGWRYPAFDEKDSATVRAKYGLGETDSLTYQITIQVPMKTFSYAIEIPPPVTNAITLRHADRFALIQDPESSKFSDAILISRENVEFYCHKVIVAQTDPLETMLSDPLAGLLEESATSPTDQCGTKRKAMDPDDDSDGASTIEDPPTREKTEHERGYKFKEMSTSSLKAMIEYLYTGQSTLTGLSVTETIELADAAEQYLLKPLKESCAAHLWRRVVTEPRSAFEIVRFADLHDDWKHLKYRSLDVIVDNYQTLNIKPRLLAERFGGTRSEELMDEFVDYMAQRRCPDMIA